MLSKENSAQTGKFRSFAYQDGIMDAVTDPDVTQVSVMKSALVGYTKILDHVVAYYLSYDPSPILVVQPRVEDAEDYSKTEIAPMIRDTPRLTAIAPEAKAKDTGQTILKKQFSNGANLTLVGANSPGGFRRITCRIILFDEVDGYPFGGAGAEGDQIALGIARRLNFDYSICIKNRSSIVHPVSIFLRLA
ncbi:phage terminase large subunit family protein [Candidatus Arsenophonus triatominarum]|uniref:phage terminase large subunit family protein n=1 Tax=Candidatus Arsenophonus triatominarum TaxID=57911 RepID=UPI001FE0CADA|nr:phage terminase large subunit family protein [Candidatus Arsenophonus triatominarum]